MRLSEHIAMSLKDENCYSIDEGLLGNAASFLIMKRMDQEHLITGVLNMYDYIQDNTDIKKFFLDYPVKERPFWKTLYNLYDKKLFSIFEGGEDLQIDQSEDDDSVIIKITPEMRRSLRKDVSGNNSQGITISDIEYVFVLHSEEDNKTYLLTINKQVNIIKRVFNMSSREFLIKMFEKMNGE